MYPEVAQHLPLVTTLDPNSQYPGRGIGAAAHQTAHRHLVHLASMDLPHQAGVELEEIDLKLLDILGAHHILAGMIDGQHASEHTQGAQRSLEGFEMAGHLRLGELQDQPLVGTAWQLEQSEEEPALEVAMEQTLGAESQADRTALVGALAQQRQSLLRHQPIQLEQQPHLLRHRHEDPGRQWPPLLILKVGEQLLLQHHLPPILLDRLDIELDGLLLKAAAEQSTPAHRPLAALLLIQLLFVEEPAVVPLQTGALESQLRLLLYLEQGVL